MKIGIDSAKELLAKAGKIKSRAERENRKMTGAEMIECENLLNAIDGLEQYADSRFVQNDIVIPLGDNPFTSRGSSSGPFKSMGEQMRAIARAGSPGGEADQRLFEIRAATGLSEGVPSDGGFLLQPEFAGGIYRTAMSSSPILNMLKRYSLSSNSLKIPAEDETSRADGSRHGGVRGYWLDEAAEKTASKPKFRQMELNLNKVVVLVYTTDELLEDASALDRYINEVAADEIAFKVTDAVINGSGAGQPLGILNAGCTVSVAKEAGQTAATVVLENLVKMWSRMIASSRKDAVWLINQDIEPQLYTMALGIGTAGMPVFMPGGGVSKAPYATLFGRPIIPVEQCQTLGTVGDIILADPQSYILADRGGVQADMSIHVRYVYDESCFRFVYRVDGQTAIASSIVPFAGGDNLSPFVTLAERA